MKKLLLLSIFATLIQAETYLCIETTFLSIRDGKTIETIPAKPNFSGMQLVISDTKIESNKYRVNDWEKFDGYFLNIEPSSDKNVIVATTVLSYEERLIGINTKTGDMMECIYDTKDTIKGIVDTERRTLYKCELQK